MNKIAKIAIITFLGFFLMGCMEVNPSEASDTEQTELDQEMITDEVDEEIEADEEPEAEEIDLQVIQPNEAGQIMVLMYHHIREPEGEWSRTPDNFRKDLQVLYEEGYRPISLQDYATGNITTEAGYTPVVLTFDDGNDNNFNMIEDGNGQWVIDPDSAVGILVNFHEQNPDFPLEATFFINGGSPFGQSEFVEYKLNYIVEKGMDIGNHTNTHINFTNASAERIQEEVGRINEMVGEILPDYEVNTLALPFGSKPQDEALRKYLVEGTYQGNPYKHVAVLEVGWDPYHSPYHESFNGATIHRVRASETKVDGVGMYDWMKALDQGGRLRYISDGDPNIVTVPKAYADRLSDEIEGKEIRTYELIE